MNLPHRARVVVTVTALSALAGAVAGLGIVGLVFISTTMNGARTHYIPGELFALGSQTGAMLGSILGPLAAFGFMRRVALGRLFTATAVGTARGGFTGFVAAALVLPHAAAVAAVISGGVIGFGIAASNLWWRATRSEATSDRLLASVPHE